MKNSTKVIGSFAMALGLSLVPAFADTLYTDIPTTDTSNGPETTSYAAYANGLTSFGSLVNINGGYANSATVVLSNYAQGTGTYTSNMTLNIYQLNNGATGDGGDPTVGQLGYSIPNEATLVKTVTQDQTITELQNTSNGVNPICGSSGAPQSFGGGNFACGNLNFVNFNLGGNLASGEYIVTASINDASTNQQLNWALNNWVGSDNSCGGNNPICTSNNPQYDTNYLNGVVNKGWSSIGQAEFSINATPGAPEPATFGLIGIGLVGLGVSVRRKSRKI